MESVYGSSAKDLRAQSVIWCLPEQQAVNSLALSWPFGHSLRSCGYASFRQRKLPRETIDRKLP
jgi:hypothetical protein